MWGKVCDPVGRKTRCTRLTFHVSRSRGDLRPDIGDKGRGEIGRRKMGTGETCAGDCSTKVVSVRMGVGSGVWG
jgi:hypothetical protein